MLLAGLDNAHEQSAVRFPRVAAVGAFDQQIEHEEMSDDVGKDSRGEYIERMASCSALKGRNISAQGKRGGVSRQVAALGWVVYGKTP